MEKEQTWAQISYSAMNYAQSKKESNPLEVSLFADYMNTIPDYISQNEGTWAHVVAGFDDYARENARRRSGESFSKITFDSFVTAIMPGSSVIKGTLSGSTNIINGADTYTQAVIIIRYGPQVFNKAWYEGGFGKPPHPWSSYHPGWIPYKKPE